MEDSDSRHSQLDHGPLPYEMDAGDGRGRMQLFDDWLGARLEAPFSSRFDHRHQDGHGDIRR